MRIFYLFACSTLFSATIIAQGAEPVEHAGKWGFKTPENKRPEFKYDRVLEKDDAYFPVVTDEHWGIVNEKGIEIIPCMYDSIIAGHTYFIALRDDKYGVVDTANVTRLDFVYDAIDHYTSSTGSTVKTDGRWATYLNGTLDFDSRVVFYRPQQRAVFGDCSWNLPKEELEQCSFARLMEYVYVNVRYPALARENGIQGRVIIDYLVSPEGKVTEPRIFRDIGGGCGEESLKIVRNMPDWKPAMQDGVPVWYHMILPVSFKLEGRKKKN